jgi:16S rRNA processing protein RimM
VDRDTVSIGRLGAPKGVRGDLKVHSHSGESAHFRKLKEVELLSESAAAGAAAKKLRVKISRIEGEGPSLTIAFEGYASPEAARVLTGMEIIVPRSAASPLRPNEWYVDDLVGLALVDASEPGRKLAVVRSILEGGAEPWLEVVRLHESGSHRGAEGAAIIPFRKEFVGAVDLKAGTIELLLPELLSTDLPDDGRPDE